jgi:hypothetical protein
MELLVKFGAGLMLVGIGVVIFDFFTARLIKKIYPDPEYWNEELNFPTLSPEDQKSFPQRKRLYQDAISHRFRKWGIAIFVIGGLLVAASAML